MQAVSTFSSRTEAASTERVVTSVAVIRLMEYRGPLYFFIFIGFAHLSNFAASLFPVSKSMMHYHSKISPTSWNLGDFFFLIFFSFFFRDMCIVLYRLCFKKEIKISTFQELLIFQEKKESIYNKDVAKGPIVEYIIGYDEIKLIEFIVIN